MRNFLLSILFLIPLALFAQVNVTTNNNAAALAQMLAGQGVVVKNATMNCAGTAAGTFTGGQANLNFTLNEGIVLGTGNVSNPNAGGLICLGTDHGRAGYNRLNAIAGATTNDACILEFDVEVTTSTLEFKYVFGSDEYPEYVGSSFNDAFGFFISGPGIVGVQNIGVLPGGVAPITINSVNNGDTDAGPCTNCQYYRPNTVARNGLDGSTQVLTATAKVIPCETYHFVIAIADGSDGCWDSSVFLEKSSLVSVGVDMTQPLVSGNLGVGRIYENCDSAIYTFNLPTALANDYTFKIAIKGTAQNGVDYRFLVDSLVIPAGSTSLSFTILPITDSIVDPGETVEICVLDPCTNAELICEFVTIEELEAEITEEQNICYGDTVQLEVTYNANYNYQWSPSNTLSCATCHNPKAYPTDTTEYTVVVSDKTCSLDRKVLVNVAAGALPPIQDTIACIDSTKRVDVSTPGFNSYDWTPSTSGLSGGSSATPTFTVLDSAVRYTVVATNEYGCELTSDILISPRPAVDAEIVTGDILCFGDSTGSLRANVFSPTAIDSFIWSNGHIGNPNLNLKAGDFQVRIVDIYGCQGIFDTLLIQPDAPLEVIASELAPANCGGNDGEAEGIITGGTEPYNFTWSPNTTTTTLLANQLYAGIYTLSVTDANGCTASDTVLVRNDDSGQQDATITPFGPFCLGAPAITAEAAMPNGIWSGPGIDAAGNFTPANAGSGSHRIIYRIDAGFCSDADTFYVEVNSAFQADINPIQPICELASTVKLVSVTSGGLYWGPGIVDSSFSNFNPGLAGPGRHWVYHLVQGECGELDSLEIEVLPAAQAQIGTLPRFCPTGASGMLMATPSDGKWSGPGVDSTGLFDPTLVGAGSYTLTYTPNNACRIIDTETILVVDTLRAQAQNINLLCNGDNNGQVNTSVIGGQAPYSYTWNNAVSGNSPSASGLSAGSYPVTVQDSLGCSVQVTHIVNQPTPVALANATRVVDASCFASCDGEVQLYPQGGTAPYTYTINSSTAIFNGVDGFTGLCQGNYTVEIRDANNCLFVENISINQPTAISVASTSQTAFCNQANGSITVSSVSGGSAPYSYSWSNGDTTQSLDSVTPGNYVLTVTDDNACVQTFTMMVPNTGGPSLSASFSPANCFGEASGKAWVTAINGVTPYQYAWNYGGSISDTLSNAPAGTYQVVVTDNSNCADSITAQITEPTRVSLAAIEDSLLCVGQVYQRGLNAMGGNQPSAYQYHLNSVPLSGNNISINTAGTYQVQAFDSKNCPSEIRSFDINYRAPISTQISADDSICAGDPILKTVTASGGKAPYTYSWENGPSLSQFTYNSNQGASNSTKLRVRVSDGCSPDVLDSTMVHYFPLPDMGLSVDPLNGCAPLTVNFSSDQNVLSSISWSINNQNAVTGDFLFSREFVNPGAYTVSATGVSNKGCRLSENFPDAINVYPVPNADIRINPNVLTVINNQGLLSLSSDIPLANADWQIVKSGDTLKHLSGLRPNYTFGKTPAEFEIFAQYQTVYGCENTAYLVVPLESEDILYVPTAFSPNNDGTNETFSVEVIGEEPSTFNVYIFDRWGEQLFHSSKSDFEWDGVYLGEDCKPGVFVWAITYTTYTGITRSLQGKVTLLR